MGEQDLRKKLEWCRRSRQELLTYGREHAKDLGEAKERIRLLEQFVAEVKDADEFWEDPVSFRRDVLEALRLLGVKLGVDGE